MNKKQLVKRVSQKTGLTLTESNEFLNSVLDTISDTLKNRENVFLRGFGSFMIKERKPRRTMSLNTRKMITIPGEKGCEVQDSDFVKNEKERLVSRSFLLTL